MLIFVHVGTVLPKAKAIPEGRNELRVKQKINVF